MFRVVPTFSKVSQRFLAFQQTSRSYRLLFSPFGCLSNLHSSSAKSRNIQCFKFSSAKQSTPSKDPKSPGIQQSASSSQFPQQQTTQQLITGSAILKDEESKKNELDLVFAKNQKAQEKPFDASSQLNEFEKKVHSTNLNVLRREIFNDSMQIPIKFLAYYLAGHAAMGTFLAEFCRSSIDAVNHAMLYLANSLDLKPNKQYPQGMENLKFLIVLIPSSLFLCFGGYTIFSAFTEFFNAVPATVIEEHNSLYSILLYLASFGVEISVIAYNIRDSIKMQNINNKDDKPATQSLFSIMRALVSKKDPLLQAVLYENMITLMSMSVPLFVGVTNMIIPSNIPEFIGQNIIGLIELMLGYRLGKETTQALLGQSVDEDIMKNIHEEILRNPYVKSIRDETGIMSGSVRFKYYAIVEYDYAQLTEDAMEDYRQMSEYIIYSQDYKDRQEELEDLMESFPMRLLREIKKQEESILLSIQRKYPQCDYFDINMDRQQLYEFLDEEEKIQNSFHQEIESDDEKREETEDEKLIKEWVLETSSVLMHKSFHKSAREIPRSNDSLYYETLPFKVNPKHYSNDLHPVFVQEKTLVFEHERTEIILDELNSPVAHQDSSNPLPKEF